MPFASRSMASSVMKGASSAHITEKNMPWLIVLLMPPETPWLSATNGAQSPFVARSSISGTSVAISGE